MRTALVTHCWLDFPGEAYAKRLPRFIDYYQGLCPVTVIDNGSSPATGRQWANTLKSAAYILTATPHYDRASMLDYPYVWRNYWVIKDLLQTYDRIFYIATDARIISQRLLDYLEGLEEGWVALWSPKYNFPEPCIQVITRCEEFEEFFAGPCDPFKYNGQIEELTLPFTHVEHGFMGDRYGEYGPGEVVPPLAEMDYYTQLPDEGFDDSLLPVIRRIDGKATVTNVA